MAQAQVARGLAGGFVFVRAVPSGPKTRALLTRFLACAQPSAQRRVFPSLILHPVSFLAVADPPLSQRSSFCPKRVHSRVLGSGGVNEGAASVFLRCSLGVWLARASVCELGTRRAEGRRAMTCEAEAQNGRQLIAGPEGQPIIILERGLEREQIGQAGRFPELAGAFDAGLELTAG